MMVRNSILAIDPGSASIGWAWLKGFKDGGPVFQYGTFEVVPGWDLNKRLVHLFKQFSGFLIGHKTDCIDLVIEDYNYGARNKREVSGESVGMIKVVAMQQLIKSDQIHRLAIPAWKKFIYPDWPGWTKINWANAGRAGKFKRSQPTKTAIRHRLLNDYAINVKDENVADAICIALAWNKKMKYGTDWVVQ